MAFAAAFFRYFQCFSAERPLVGDPSHRPARYDATSAGANRYNWSGASQAAVVPAIEANPPLGTGAGAMPVPSSSAGDNRRRGVENRPRHNRR